MLDFLYKLECIRKACKASVFIDLDGHKDNGFETITEYLDIVHQALQEPELTPEILEKMEELDSVVHIACYLDTSVGSYSFFHYDLEKAVNEAYQFFKSMGKIQEEDLTD